MLALIGIALLSVLCTSVQAVTPAEQLAAYTAQAGAPAQASRGQQFFTTKHASTGKQIGPLAPAFNPERFTDAAKTEKWFRRNCNDVAGRECTVGEKADVLAWLQTRKR